MIPCCKSSSEISLLLRNYIKYLPPYCKILKRINAQGSTPHSPPPPLPFGWQNKIFEIRNLWNPQNINIPKMAIILQFLWINIQSSAIQRKAYLQTFSARTWNAREYFHDKLIQRLHHRHLDISKYNIYNQKALQKSHLSEWS